MALLKQQIQQRLIDALKNKKELEVSTLRLVISAIGNKEIEKRTKLVKQEPNLPEAEMVKKSQLTEEEIMEVISNEAKKRKESILAFEQGNRPELAEKEKEEIAILKVYLPEQLSEEEVRKIVKDAIAALRASLAPEEREKTGINMGLVMKEIMPLTKGRADGALTSTIVKELLGK
ncbi:MAG: GatB/YqeY domain-containing protein [Candidatus Parcubacteria bacterium]|nr:GatB/YqeY domain-containing protein [Candidatus Parcubacteria bacterium]